jgi:hypothetical protein
MVVTPATSEALTCAETVAGRRAESRRAAVRNRRGSFMAGKVAGLWVGATGEEISSWEKGY